MGEKFKIYLDQNILQYDFEGSIKIPENNDIQYVYSDEHFNEITRWENDGYFDVLRRLKARKIKSNLDNNNKFTDNGFLYDYSEPKIMYEEYKNNQKNYMSSFNMFQPMQVYLNGNKSITSPEEINNNFQKTIKDLLGNTLKSIGNEELTSKYNLMVENIGDQLESSLANQDILPLDKARRKLSKENLSNLIPENGLIIDQIWERISDEFKDIEKDQFFGKKPFNFQFDFKYSKFQNVIHCHSILNYLGYWPDEGLTKISKIYGVNSDASHLAHSIFCDGIMSGDRRMCNKASAIFSYINLNTKVFRLTFENEKEIKQ